MSYILDALKKADAQRERDPARGIHAQPAVVAGAAHAGESYRNWAWGAGAAAVLAIAWAFWATYEDRPSAALPIQTRSEPAPAPVAAAQAPVVTPASAPVTPAVVAAVPLATASSQPVATAVQPPPAAPRIEPVEPKSPLRPVPRARPQLDAAPGPGATVAGPQPGTGRAPVAAPSPAPAEVPSAHAAPAAAAPPAAADTSVIARGLPPDAPKLAISGGVYSKNPAQRMLIVNGQVFSQGADLGSGVVLEEIRPKAAVLRFNGGRYSVAF